MIVLVICSCHVAVSFILFNQQFRPLDGGLGLHTHLSGKYCDGRYSVESANCESRPPLYVAQIGKIEFCLLWRVQPAIVATLTFIQFQIDFFKEKFTPVSYLETVWMVKRATLFCMPTGQQSIDLNEMPAASWIIGHSPINTFNCEADGLEDASWIIHFLIITAFSPAGQYSNESKWSAEWLYWPNTCPEIVPNLIEIRWGRKFTEMSGAGAILNYVF